MPNLHTRRSLELMILQAHRAKGIRYLTSSRKDCFKTWYSYALRRGGVERMDVKNKNVPEYGRVLEGMGTGGGGGGCICEGSGLDLGGGVVERGVVECIGLNWMEVHGVGAL
ncbi:hypothetical protein P280DRAFT_541662 [Massarina eburnea CBS 473.64]|uniref:Uncharacterized protein n=1 Tax=Massarina eburnea CBS 473.64 TaxID=1395130 RepID=A0A6A6S6N3_9PLEO|nr:hypothetical protein P280DRAFT_541662 [Massarina eburnea CBS 473.64]